MPRKDGLIGDQSGAALVELSLIALLLAISILGGIELLVTNFRQNSLTHAVNSTGRWAILGQQDTGKSREESIQDRIIGSAAQFGVTLADSNVMICPADTPDCASDDAGGSGAYFD